MKVNDADLVVNIIHDGDRIVMNSDIGQIEIITTEETRQDDVCDFAVWFFLPIAMKLNRNLHIDAACSNVVLENARKLSFIWQSWIPNHFYAVSVSSASSSPSNIATEKDLAFYSGGVDSTYSILNRLKNGFKQDLLTVHGMEYDYKKSAQFDLFLNKTNLFAEFAGGNRLIVRNNSYTLYNQIECNPKGAHVTHIFALAGSAYLFSNYKNFLIASDYRLDQQFLVSPWGSNSATNRFFTDGTRQLLTLDDHISRSDKLLEIMNSKEALKSITFCVNKEIRPNNCGQCSKCIRTKAMFLARMGCIPEIFINNNLPDDWFEHMNLKKQSDRVFLSDILISCEIYNNKNLLPQLHYAYELYNSHGSKKTKTILHRLFKK